MAAIEPGRFLVEFMEPALVELVGISDRPQMASDDSKRFLLAVALQESRLLYRKQLNSGPARGFWQCEVNPKAAIGGVLDHKQAGAWLREACAYYSIPAQRTVIWEAVTYHDRLATIVARLTLWCDPFLVPRTEAGAWECYAERTWKPGKPKVSTWPRNWAVAGATVFPS